MDGRRPGGIRIKTGSTEYISSLLATLSFAVATTSPLSIPSPPHRSSDHRFDPARIRFPALRYATFVSLFYPRPDGPVLRYIGRIIHSHYTRFCEPPPPHPVGVVLKIIQYRTVCSYPSHTGSSFQNALFRLYRLYRLTSLTETSKLYNAHWHWYSIKHHHKWFFVHLWLQLFIAPFNYSVWGYRKRVHNTQFYKSVKLLRFKFS